MNKSSNLNTRKPQTRMSIDLPEQEHKKIKVRAAREGISIREFVIECIFSRMVKDQYQDRKNPQDEEDFF